MRFLSYYLYTFAIKLLISYLVDIADIVQADN